MKKFISYISYNLKLLRFFLSRPKLEKDTDYVKSLRKNGIITINDFENYFQDIKKLNLFTDSLNLDEIIENKKKNIEITDDHRANLKREFKINITNLFDKELLLSYSKNKYTNDIIYQYFGFSPMVRNISVWIDVPNENLAEEVATQVFHRDFDDIKLIKTFLYLNNVENQNGPFEYILTSHKKPWENNNKIIDNDSVLKKFKKENFMSVTGKKNTLIIADTNGFHHGKKLTKGYRILLTASYTSNNPSVKMHQGLFG